MNSIDASVNSFRKLDEPAVGWRERAEGGVK